MLATALEGFNANMDPSKGKKPWHDDRVRKAVYRVTNREQFLSLVFSDKGVIPVGPMPASLTAYQLEQSDVDEYYKNDIQEAKQLMDAAAVDNSRDYEIIVYNSTPLTGEAAEVWAQQLEPLGLGIRITALPFPEWLPKRIAPGDYDLIIGRQPGGDTPYRVMRNNHSETNDQYSHVGLYDADIDAMIEKSETTTDREEQIQLVKDLEKRSSSAIR